MKSFLLCCLCFVVFQSSSVAQWQKVNTTFKNKIWALVASGNNLIVAADSGVYHSTDGGGTWVQKNKGLATVVQHYYTLQQHGGALYVGSGTSGAYKSTDMGESWQKTDKSSGYVGSIISAENTILMGGNSALIGFIIVSGDNGVTWKNTGFLPEVRCLTWFNTTFIAGTMEGQLLLSTDGGNTWNRKLGFYNTLHVFTRQGNRIIGGGNGGKIIVSEDGFTTSQEYSFPTSSSFIRSMDATPNLVVAGSSSDGIFISKDGGKTWTAANTGLGNLSINMVKILGNKVYVATGDGLYTASVESFGAATTVEEDNASKDEIQLTPNPSHNTVDIHAQCSQGLGYVQLYSMLGEQVLNLKDIESNTCRIDISSLASGSYLLRTNCGTRLLVKQ